MKFIDICSGIGGFRTALEKNGHECVAFAEIDKYAIQSYKAIYDTENEIELGDITNMPDEELQEFKGNCDIIVGGTPCQSFSLAGKRLGFEDTRGTVFFSYVNAIKQIQPKYFLFENVKGLISHDKGNTIKVILKAFQEVGYDLDFEIFNSKFYDVPQNRERIYIMGVRKDLSEKPFKEIPKGKKKLEELKQWAGEEIEYKQLLPEVRTEITTRLIDVLEDEVDEKFYLSDEKVAKLTLDHDFGKTDYKIKQIGNIVNNKETFGGNPQRGRVYDSKGISPALNCMRGGGLEPKVAVVGNTSATGYKSHDIHDVNGIIPTLAARDYKGPKQVAIPVLTPERLNKSQNGRRFKEDGEPMFTLTSQDRHGIAIREATKQGYAIAEQGDSVNVSYPTSKTRRGRVGKQVAQTLQAGEVNQGVVMSDIRIRKLTPLECWRLQGFSDEQFYKAKNDGLSNSQLYKQAGNSVTVNVVDSIVQMMEGEKKAERFERILGVWDIDGETVTRLFENMGIEELMNENATAFYEVDRAMEMTKVWCAV
ncbi:DNA (cytosine-5-)-methyltransferase [Staphylococcus equorum]|uniref:DNA (cytosine-5-)-methyltransferase n=1 Tax=Staphylococcus equorum TaxID=246432 RepID=UPI003CF0AB6E